MPKCKKELVDKLYDHCLVKLPKSTIFPTNLYQFTKEGLLKIGDLTDLFITSEQAALPKLSENTPTPDLKGEQSNNMHIKFGLGILNNFVSAITGSNNINLEGSLGKTHRITFELQDVVCDSADLIELEIYINSAGLKNSPGFINKLQNGELYVITSTLKSKSFSILTFDENNKGVALDVPVIQQIVGTNVSVSSTKEKSQEMTYQGNTNLVFGVQAVKINFNNKKKIYTLQPQDVNVRAVKLKKIGTEKMNVSYFQPEKGNFVPFIA